MTQFVKALDKGDCFSYITKKFHHISPAKLKAGILYGSHIRKLLKDYIFITKMKKDEKAAWISFKNAVENFLGN